VVELREAGAAGEERRAPCRPETSWPACGATTVGAAGSVIGCNAAPRFGAGYPEGPGGSGRRMLVHCSIETIEDIENDFATKP
jgi:hypothetical protein